jgi:hypothetical protein
MPTDLVPRDYAAWLAERPLPTDDPRPDLGDDSDLWAQLLKLAWSNAPHELWGTLHGLRCLGARLVSADEAAYGQTPLRIVAGDIAPVEYARLRERYLMPYADMVQELIARLNELVPQRAP